MSSSAAAGGSTSGNGLDVGDLEADWASIRPRSSIEVSEPSALSRMQDSRLSTSLDQAQPTLAAPPQRHSLPRHATVHDVRLPSRPAMLERIGSLRSVSHPEPRPASLDFGEGPGSQVPNWRSTAVGSTPLDRTMDRIGMGKYQWTVLILSGLGWAADNMWIQAIAIVLPHVQRTFEVADTTVGLASSSIFVGMFVGSLVWGSISDSYGRRAAFNMTLMVTAVFGTLSALSTSFAVLCFLLFSVGTGVGGSMPTDSSNLVENLPVRKHSYVTALSVFFSAGAVVPSVIGLMVLSDGKGSGWRWLLGCLAAVTIVFVAARVVFFRLLESPKYLVHAGRPQEAREILQRIQRYNGGEPVTIKLRDVCDDTLRQSEQCEHSAGPSTPRGSTSRPRPKSWHSSSRLRSDQKGYRSLPTDDDDADDDGLDVGEEDGLLRESPAERGPGPRSGVEAGEVADLDPLPRWLQWLPSTWHPTAADLLSRYAELFSPEWKQTTVLVWIIWGGMSFAYTSFNVFLPKLLEERYGHSSDSSSNAAMIDYLLYTVSSLPGSLISAYLVETRLGRIGTMASSTALTGAAVLVFALFSWRMSLTVISIAASISYAAIYGYTPEVMGPKIRATACGSASAISRVAGIVAPLSAGLLFSLNSNLPLYLSVVSFLGVAMAMAMLPIETRGRATTGEDGGGAGPGTH